MLLFSLLAFLTGSSGAAEPRCAELLFAGDAMQHQAQIDQARLRGDGGYDYSDCFTYIAPKIGRASCRERV